MQTPSNTPYIALIPAAGVGSRMGSQVPKQYLEILGKPVIQHTLEAFTDCSRIRHTYIVVSPADAYIDQAFVAQDAVSVLRCGGESRAETVQNGLQYLLQNNMISADDWVLVHDAARPGLTVDLVCRLIDQVAEDEVGGLLALPVVDTVKRMIDGQVQTISREGMWLAQTPQMFRAQRLLDAIKQAPQVTDEASAIEFVGGNPKLVEGHAHNRKLTLPDDVDYLTMVLQNKRS